MQINNENKEIWIVGSASKELLDNTILNAEGEYSIKFTKPENRFCFKSTLQQKKTVIYLLIQWNVVNSKQNILN